MKKLIKHKAFEVLSNYPELINPYNVVFGLDHIFICDNQKDENQTNTYSNTIAEIFKQESGEVYLIPVTNEDDNTIIFKASTIINWGLLLKDLEKAFEE